MTNDQHGAGEAIAPSPWGPSSHLADMPAETPTMMPVQSLQTAPDPTRPPRTSPSGMTERRLLLVLGTLVIATFGAGEITRSLSSDGISLIDVALMLLFFALFAWISFGFLNAFAGFLLLVSGRSVPTPAASPSAMPVGRTAILLPIHNEEVEPVFRPAARDVAIDRCGRRRATVRILSSSRTPSPRTRLPSIAPSAACGR